MQESNLDQNSGVNVQPQNNIPQAQPPIQPVENQPSAQTSSSTKSKLPLMLIVIFVFLIILGSGAYYFLGVKKTSNNKACPDIARICKGGSTAKPGPNCTQTCPEDSLSPNPTIDETANPDQIGANWKTYEDKENGISFKYPPELYVKSPSVVNNTVTLLFEEYRGQGLTNQPEFGVTTFSDGITLDTAVKNVETLAKNTGQKINFRKVMVDNNEAYRNENILNNSSFNNITTLVEHKDKRYQIIIFSTEMSNEQKNMYDKILSTFRFTN